MFVVEPFFLKHYKPGYFDVIVIDECHRSAWGDWFAVLERNNQGIHVGLTATPREIRLPETDDKDLKSQIEEDKRLLSDNLKYFGDATYEPGLFTLRERIVRGIVLRSE